MLQNNSENNDNDLLPVRMLNELVYCERLFYLEYVQGDFQDSAETIEGRYRHHNVDKEKGDLPNKSVHEEANSSIPIHASSVMLSGEVCKFIARMDLIEGSGKEVQPVEYKRGKPPDNPDRVWPSDLIQVCAQAIILRENGFDCNRGVVYYFETKQRILVEITEELIRTTMSYAEKARSISTLKIIPKPLVDSPKCPKCSLVSICLPDETNSMINIKGEIDDTDVRRLYPARDDSLPVYVLDQGAIVGKKGEELEIKQSGKVVSRIKLMETSQLSIFGNVQVTTQTIQELCRRGIPVCYFSFGGWFNGMTQGITHKNVELRIHQYEIARDQKKALTIATKFVNGKIRNCRTLLKRNLKVDSEKALEELKKYADSALRASDLPMLLGIEGTAARIYFMHFADMFIQDVSSEKFDFQSRNRRPPKDPVNAILSYLYSILSKDITVILTAVGFDPFRGFLHQPKYGNPALSLDLMEEFRPLIVDSTVLGLINNKEVTLSDFITRGDAVSMKESTKKVILKAYERRMDTLITHPYFGYSVSYRRNLEVQARLLGRVLSGEIQEYPVFYTR